MASKASCVLHLTPTFFHSRAPTHRGKDHAERRNYDDFNEFFWQRECLQCAWRPPEPPAADPESGLPTVTVVPSGAEPLHVAEAMRAGPKTFIEKRSWLAIALAFRRIIDFHVLTFQLLAVWAFWDLLCWDWPYGLQLLSSVFLTMNLLGILWCGLEVWQTIQDEDAGPVPGACLARLRVVLVACLPCLPACLPNQSTHGTIDLFFPLLFPCPLFSHTNTYIHAP